MKIHKIVFLLVCITGPANCQNIESQFISILKSTLSSPKVFNRVSIETFKRDSIITFILSNRIIQENVKAFNIGKFINGTEFFEINDFSVILFADWMANINRIPIFIILDKFKLHSNSASVTFHTSSIVYQDHLSDRYIKVTCYLKLNKQVWEINKIRIKRTGCCDKNI